MLAQRHLLTEQRVFLLKIMKLQKYIFYENAFRCHENRTFSSETRSLITVECIFSISKSIVGPKKAFLGQNNAFFRRQAGRLTSDPPFPSRRGLSTWTAQVSLRFGQLVGPVRFGGVYSFRILFFARPRWSRLTFAFRIFFRRAPQNLSVTPSATSGRAQSNFLRHLGWGA